MRRREPAARIPAEPPRSSVNDPLTELARLIGQTDPFGDQAGNHQARNQQARNQPPQPQPSYSAGLPPLMPEYREEAPPQYDRYAQQQGQYAPPQADPYADQGPYDHDQYGRPYVATAPAQYGHPVDAPYYGDNGQLMPQDQYAQHAQYAPEQYDYDEPRPGRRSGLITIVVVLGLALVGTVGAYGYRTMFNGGVSGPPPLIRADTTPNKIVPAQNSADSSAGKQIYDRVGSNTQDEKIVSREEQPVDVNANVRPVYPSAGQLPVQGQWPSSPATGQLQTGGQGGVVGGQGEPRKVHTVTIRPDSQGNVAPPPQAQRPAAPAPVPAAPRAAANGPLSLTPQASDRVASAGPAPQTTASTSVPAGIGFMVQVSAQKSAADATSAFKTVQSRYSNLLGSYQVVLRKKEVRGKGTFYGAQVGPFETRDQAAGLCEQLKTAGGNCLVEKN